MASVSLRTKSNILCNVAKRYASSAAPASQQQSRQALSGEPVRVSKLDSGVVIVSLENNSPVQRVAAVINAGSRDESSSELGASHALRVYSSLATRNFSLFGIARNLDQVGADFSVTSSREQTTYLLQGNRNSISRGFDILGDVVSRPELRRWEIDDAHHRFELDLDINDEQPETRIVELIHRAAFRNGLANSLYAPRYNVHGLTSELLQAFRQRNFTANRLTLVGVGISHDDLIRRAAVFRLPAAAANTAARQATKYLGSEIREHNNDQLVHVILASEGVAQGSKQALASNIASHAFGAEGVRIKYGNTSSASARAIVKQAASDPLSAAVAAFSINYSDAGLFGFHLVGNSQDIGSLLRGAHGQLAKASKAGLSNDEIARAKTSLKAALSYRLESPQNQLFALGQNAENAAASIDLEQQFKNIDAFSANDVNAFIQKAASGKLSLASIGDVSQLPRVDEL